MKTGREMLIVDMTGSIREVLDSLQIGYQTLTRDQAYEMDKACADDPTDATFLLTGPVKRTQSWEILTWVIRYLEDNGNGT